MQITPNPNDNLLQYKTIEIYLGTVSPLSAETDTLKLYAASPSNLISFEREFSNHAIGDLYLLGVHPDGSRRIVDTAPITGNAHMNDFQDNLKRGLAIRKEWYHKLRSEQVQLYFKSFGADCTCYNHHTFSMSDPNCPICRGQGKINSYLGTYYNVMIDNDYKKAKVRDPNGKVVVIDVLEGWVNGFPFINDETMLIRQNGDVFSLQNVIYKHLGGNLVEESFAMVLMPDTYTFNYKLI